jgi:hypothetical protein
MRYNQPARPPIPWPEGPTFTGHTYQITDVESFFLPVLNGQAPPPESYQPWSLGSKDVVRERPLAHPGSRALDPDPG